MTPNQLQVGSLIFYAVLDGNPTKKNQNQRRKRKGGRELEGGVRLLSTLFEGSEGVFKRSTLVRGV